MRILHALTCYGDTGEGDVKLLADSGGLYRTAESFQGPIRVPPHGLRLTV